MTYHNKAGESLILESRQASAFGEATLGGKAANLAWLSRNQFLVPEWFAVTTHAFDLQVGQGDVAAVIENQLKDKDADDPALTQAAETIQEAILDKPLHPDIVGALKKQLGNEPGETFYAVRSSAVGEDSALASFAGQLDSFLFQRGEKGIADAVLACFASAFNDRAIRYRLRHGMDSLATRAAVVVQRMIDSEISGVAFTAHPITGKRDYMLISAAYGSGEGIVSGLCSTDEFTLPLYGDAIEPIINEKDVALYFDTEVGFGLKQTDVETARQKIPCLSDAQVITLRDIVRSIAERLGSPQDIEWAFADGAFHILQTRPVTSLPAPQEPRGNRVVWDNSNIQESYCGVTTPLTFSFASTAYAQVYETTLKLTNPSTEEMAELKPSLDNLLGLVKGRVYYNINNWYRGLLLLPSFKSNKADMERMMGLEDPVDFVDPPVASFGEKVRKIPRLVKTSFFLLNSFRRMDKLVEEFFANFNAVYDGLDRRRFHQMEVGELIQETRNLRTGLLDKWQTPIINDFYVMMMNGRVARTLSATDLENPDVVQNKLMAGEEGIESTEPTKYLLRLCEEIRTRDALLKIFRDIENEQLMDHLQIYERAIYDRCQEYIDRYGDRTMGELKLESITLRQDPSFMFTILKNFLKRDDLKPETLEASEKALRAEAEKEATAAITKRFGKGKLKKFNRDLAKLRDAVRNRENTRLARTRMFGLFRDLYIEIGKQLAFYGVLNDPRDIFFLSVDEIEKYDQGRSVQTDWRSLVLGRKAEYEAYEADEPAHHFITNGPVYYHNDYTYPYDKAEPDTDAPQLSGIGCYPGVVEARLKLIFSPEDELDLNGQILCTVRTDPGWAPLFPSAGGILVERGSTLSHSAVVARELGIPAIVNMPGLTKIVSNGETVRMDGATGVVHRLDMKPFEGGTGSEEPGGPE